MIRFGAAALLLAITAGVSAQEALPINPVVAPTAKPGLAKQVPLKIQLVLSRYQGEKKLSSLPYLMYVTAGEPGRTDQTRLRMGVQIPVVNTVFGVSSDKDKNVSVPQTSYNYKDVGTNIDCYAHVIGDGTYKVFLTVTDTSVYFPDKDKPQTGIYPAAPSFRSFTSNFNILLRDNQTAQYTTATDQVSGDVMKIDATLNVLK
jgi:hypothetical protein